MARLTNSCLQLAHSAIATRLVRVQRTAASGFVRDAATQYDATWIKNLRRFSKVVVPLASSAQPGMSKPSPVIGPLHELLH